MWCSGTDTCHVCPSVCPSVRLCVGILEDHVVHIVERDPLPVETESRGKDNRSTYTRTHVLPTMQACRYFCQWYVVCCSAAQETPPPAPPGAPTQGASAQYTVPGSGARVTVRTIPVGGDRIDQGAMEQLTQVSERRRGGEGGRGEGGRERGRREGGEGRGIRKAESGG